jgi:CheY-like chemotaxis protein
VLPYNPPPTTRLLAAVTPDVLERLRRIIRRHELVPVQSAADALRRLDDEDHFGLVLLSVHFAESQMFTLLGDIRAHSGYRKIPILCVLGAERGRGFSDVTIEGLDHAVKAMRANGFLDLQHFDDDEEGNSRIERVVDYLILIDGDLHHIARATGEAVVPLERRRA